MSVGFVLDSFFFFCSFTNRISIVREFLMDHFIVQIFSFVFVVMCAKDKPTTKIIIEKNTKRINLDFSTANSSVQ